MTPPVPPTKTPGHRPLRDRFEGFLAMVRRRVPPGLRLVLGLLLILGGVFGFLPVLGFWMIPLGVAVAALDIRPLLRRSRRHRHHED